MPKSVLGVLRSDIMQVFRAGNATSGRFLTRKRTKRRMAFDAGKFPPFIYVPAMTLRLGGVVQGVCHTPHERAILSCSIKSAAVGAYGIRPDCADL